MANRSILYLVALGLALAGAVNLVCCADRDGSTFSYMAIGLAFLAMLMALAGCSIPLPPIHGA
jgi:hypothetical protein